MKIKDLKPSVGVMRLWIASIVIIFIISFSESFNGYYFFGYIFLDLFTFFNDFFIKLLNVKFIFPEKSKSIGWFFTRDFLHGLSVTLVYIITSTTAYLMVMWVKEGFSKSKDGN